MDRKLKQGSSFRFINHNGSVIAKIMDDGSVSFSSVYYVGEDIEDIDASILELLKRGDIVKDDEYAYLVASRSGNDIGLASVSWDEQYLRRYRYYKDNGTWYCQSDSGYYNYIYQVGDIENMPQNIVDNLTIGDKVYDNAYQRTWWVCYNDGNDLQLVSVDTDMVMSVNYSRSQGHFAYDSSWEVNFNNLYAHSLYLHTLDFSDGSRVEVVSTYPYSLKNTGFTFSQIISVKYVEKEQQFDLVSHGEISLTKSSSEVRLAIYHALWYETSANAFHYFNNDTTISDLINDVTESVEEIEWYED